MAEYGLNDVPEVDQRFGSLMDELRSVEEQLRHAIEGAANQTYEVASADGLVQVEADGRGRIVSVALARDVMAWTPDMIDDVLSATLNEALQGARSGASSVLDVLPARLRAAVDGMEAGDR